MSLYTEHLAATKALIAARLKEPDIIERLAKNNALLQRLIAQRDSEKDAGDSER